MPRSLRQLAEEEMLSHSETDSPRSLLDWCCQQIAANPHIIGELAQLDERLPCVYQLHPNLFFPALVSQELLEAFRQQYALVGLDCRLLSLFENAKSTPLFSLNLSGSRTGDTMFSRLLNGHAHELEMINLTDCTELTEGKIPNVVMPKLLTLNLGDLIGLFADWTPARCSTQRRSSDLNCSSEESRNGQTETVTKNSDAESEAEFSPNKHSSVPDFMDDNSNATLMDFDDTSVSSSDDFLLVKRRQLYGDGDWLSFEYSGEQEKLSMPPRNDKVDVVDERMCQQCDEEFGSSSSSSGTRPPNILSQKRRCRLLTSSDLNSVPKSFLTHLCPNLIALTLHGSTWDEVFPDPPRNNTQISFLTYFLGPLGSLEYLDLSYWQQLEDLRFLRPQLSHSVTSLILYNVPDLYRAMDTLCDMKALM